MKKAGKLVVLILISAMVLSLVACSSSTPEQNTSSNNSSSPTPQSQSNSTTDTSSSTGAGSKDLKLSIADLPAKTLLTELAKAMQEGYKDGTVSSNIYPPARALENVKNGESDLLVPYIYNPNIKSEGTINSSETLWNVTFVLYTNKSNKEINLQNLYNYKIEVFPAHSAHFNNSPESDPQSGLQKVEAGRIDGYITSLSVGDTTIKNLNLKNIKRWKYAEFEAKAIFNDNEKGKAAEKIFSTIIKDLKASGKYQEIMKPKLEEKFVEDPE